MLKKWVCAPLYNQEKIEERLDSIDDLRRDGGELIKQFWDKVKNLPDLERECSAIYKLSAKTSVTLLTFDRLDLERLKDFYNLLSKIKYINEILSVFKTARFKFKSKRLRNLVSI
jgi:DNA mismatch repair ATPase MutS